ncbi:predicted protein [Histoplasma capsulatum G186AR]|uniref:Uncharacterized protein n=1 Tax=Ajellomyces capsulatus (strain G186AR / H82 / ATCC MYA-2454 / RMSCC 2432) TaxID=447093 RepID=C0NR23_AJECG|nr:uncharacterized protein HCBG_05453 [Histoplasma capsulatum G186AR]EEH06137.1 predicted protein [Histoplasma capsulatum G186AR]
MGIKGRILMHYVNRICARLKYPQYQNDWILYERIPFENSWHCKAFKLTIVQEALLIRKINATLREEPEGSASAHEVGARIPMLQENNLLDINYPRGSIASMDRAG